MVLCRHQLLSDDELGPLYDLLIDEPPEIRHAIGELVYDHLIAQKFSSSRAGLHGKSLWMVALFIYLFLLETEIWMVATYTFCSAHFYVKPFLCC